MFSKKKKHSTKKVIGKSGYVTVLSLVQAYMKEHGFDGLCTSSDCDVDCACAIDNQLMHRGDCLEGNCKFGYFVPEDHEDFDHDYYFTIGPVKY